MEHHAEKAQLILLNTPLTEPKVSHLAALALIVLALKADGSEVVLRHWIHSTFYFLCKIKGDIEAVTNSP